MRHCRQILLAAILTQFCGFAVPAEEPQPSEAAPCSSPSIGNNIVHQVEQSPTITAITADAERRQSRSFVASKGRTTIAKESAATPRLIGPFDVLKVSVEGTIADQPIDGSFVVEGAGILNLGSTYGSVNVNGLDIVAARAVITKHLQSILVKPEVQAKIDERPFRRGIGYSRSLNWKTLPSEKQLV